MPWSRDDITRLIEVEAQLQGVDPRLAVAVAQQESSLDPNNPGDNGASRGVFHLQRKAAIDAGIDPAKRDDPAIGIFGGVKYLKQQLDRSKGHIPTALSYYNRGTPEYRGIGDPDYVYHVMRHYPEHPLGKAPEDQAAYRARLNKTFGTGTAPEEPRQQPGIMARVGTALSPGSAEAATPQAAPRSRLEEIEAELARREGQTAPPAPTPAPALPAAPATQPSPPTARSTPEQDAAYRASRGTQAPPPVSQAAPPTTTQPRSQEEAKTPDTSWTPGMRFQALPSIQQLEPVERTQRTQEFAALTPALQEEFLRSEAPAGQRSPALPASPGPPGAQMEGNLLSDRAQVAEGGPQVPLRTAVPAAAKETAAIALPIAGTLGGAALGALTSPVTGAVGPIAGATLGGGLATRASTALGLTTPETPLVETPYANLYPSDVVGATLNVAAPIAARTVAKVGNALRGVVKPAYQSIVDTADKYGIRLTYGDVTKGSIAPKVETALEALPLTGGGGARVRGQQDVARAGETLSTGLATEMKQTPWRDLASVQQAARGTGPRAKEAQILLTEISEAGDDWGRVIQTSGKLNLFQDRVRAEKLYNRVEELAQPLGNMRLPKATQAIDDALARANDDVLPSPEIKREVIGALNRIKGEISPRAGQPQPSMGVRDPVTGTLRAEPVTQATNIPDTTYMRMRGLRSSLGDLQREAAEPATARYLGGVKTALEEDMAEFAAKSHVPGLAKAAKDADTFYRTRIVPYREGTLAKAIEKNIPDEIYNQFVRRGKDRAQYFYNGLDPKGQAAVRYGMVEEAVEKATGGEPGIFSPARFATSLKKIQDAHGVFFKGTPQWEINGLTNVMEHGKRFGQYMENPPTGLRGAFLGAMVGTGGLAAIPYAAKALTIGQGLRLMLMTQRGRNFLLAASDMQPGSHVFQQRLDAFLRTLPAAAAGAGAAVRAPEETAAQ